MPAGPSVGERSLVGSPSQLVVAGEDRGRGQLGARCRQQDAGGTSAGGSLPPIRSRRPPTKRGAGAPKRRRARPAQPGRKPSGSRSFGPSPTPHARPGRWPRPSALPPPRPPPTGSACAGRRAGPAAAGVPVLAAIEAHEHEVALDGQPGQPDVERCPRRSPAGDLEIVVEGEPDRTTERVEAVWRRPVTASVEVHLRHGLVGTDLTPARARAHASSASHSSTLSVWGRRSGRDPAAGQRLIDPLAADPRQLARQHVVEHLAPLAEAGLDQAPQPLLGSSGERRRGRSRPRARPSRPRVPARTRPPAREGHPHVGVVLDEHREVAHRTGRRRDPLARPRAGP